MSNSSFKANGGLRAFVTGALAIALVVASAAAPVRAADDDENESFDQKLMRQFMEGIGLRKDGNGIDYHERSPLVVPPSRSLPPPETATSAENNPAWPVDADVKRRKAERAAAKREYYTSGRFEDDARPVKPSELRRGSVPRSQQGRATASESEYDSARTMKPWELGSNGGIFGSLFGKNEEVATFTQEPPRANLTDPPVGYQTPSPNQPYGFKKKNEYKAFDLTNRGVDNFGN